MNKLTLPKNAINGIKIFCKKCRQNNTNCSHYEFQNYRIMIHVPGTKGGTKSKMLKSRNYDDAVIESIEFKKSLINNQFEINESFEMTLYNGIILYNRYLNGEHEIKQYQKTVNTTEYINEQLRAIKEFINLIQSVKKISHKQILVSDINKHDVSKYYEYCENNFKPKTFNKRMSELKRFFQYLIDCEELKMTNPFNNVNKKRVVKKEPKTIQMNDFQKLLEHIEISDPIKKVGSEIKNMYRPYLKDGFLLLLYTGGRFDDVVNMKWSDLRTDRDIEYFYVVNHKVNKLKKLELEDADVTFKRFTIFPEFKELLLKLGYENMKGKDEYVLLPQRNITNQNLRTQLSKSFSHYRDISGLPKDISIKTLRKTHITQLYDLVAENTRLVTDHATDNILREHYVNRETLNTQEKIKSNLKFIS